MRSLALLLLAIASFGVAQVERGEPLPRKPVFGAQLAPLTPDDAAKAGVPGGAKIVRVLPGLTAEKLGLKEGDIVLAAGSTPVGAPAQISAFMRDQVAGKETTWKVHRDGKTLELKAAMVERPRQQEEGLEVVYDQVLSKGKRIRVIATYPKGEGPFPTIFLIGGIGAYSVDANFAGMPYGNVMGPLAKRYATVRIDKPGQGDSEGPVYTELLFDTELDAYLQALRLAKTFSFVDKERIAIFGHSMGGCFGPLIAQQEKVAGVAASGTVGKTWMEYMLENTRRQSLLAGAKAGDVDTEIRQMLPAVHLIFGEGLTVAEAKEKFPQFAASINSVAPDGKTYSGVGIPFFQQLATKNLMAAWEKTDAKVALLYCENDFISGGDDHKFIVDTVNSVRPGTADYILVPQSDHGFSQTTSPKDSQEKWGRGGQFNPNIIEFLGTWLDKTLKK